MKASVIRCTLDLLIRLIDTTTGAEVEERKVLFHKDGQRVYPVSRGSGNYVFLNSGRENCELEITVSGYETGKAAICYEQLDRQMPIQEVFLIPSEDIPGGQPVVTFSGRLSGIEEVQAVSLRTSDCSVHEFDERKRIIKLFKNKKPEMDDIYYGLIHPEQKTYEPFTVVKVLSENSVKISQPLQEPFSVNSPVARVVFGNVTPEGDYCIRVRDDSESLVYLIRYVKEGNVKFKVVDFHHLEEANLE
uniref:hypothetical protein n=1 Tax=Agathobacter sp. TaxID=2021311 RepID=UPI0040567171